MATQNDKRIRGLLTKKPFTRVMPDSTDMGHLIEDPVEAPVNRDRLRRKIVTQEQFLRELDPAGHAINDHSLYPDIWQQNSDDGKWYIQEIPRYAFSFQQIILIKHLTHLCGNDIQFELSDKKVSDEVTRVFGEFKNGWANKNMEVAWYQLAKSVKATGDGAFVGFMDNGKFGWRVFSFLNGDRLYPHYDLRTGRLNTLARTYCNYGEDGAVTKRYIDVWDDEKYYRFVADGDAVGIFDKAKRAVYNLFNIDGYKLEEETPHGFDSIPVAYMRDDNGPCWTFSQETIEHYEHAFSNLAHSNHDFGLPIMYVRGEGSEVIAAEDMSYASKIMFLPTDGEAGFLNRQDASNAYKAELDKLEESIYKQSFAVKTPELKSGDTPGVALKIMYSDAIEKAMSDSQEYDGCIDKMVEIYSWGYGIESENRLTFLTTNIRHYIEAYVHLNTSELTQNLNTAVLGGFLSKQTASEKLPYATPQEWERILQEKHDAEMNQILVEEQRLEMQNEHTVDLQEDLSEIQTEQQVEVIKAQQEASESEDENDNDPKAKQSKKKKYSVATGRGAGRPNLTGRVYTESRNWQGRSNWDSWNAKK